MYVNRLYQRRLIQEILVFWNKTGDGMYCGINMRNSKLSYEMETFPKQFHKSSITPFLSSPSVWSLLDSNSSQGSLYGWELGCLEDSLQVLLLYPGIQTQKTTVALHHFFQSCHMIILTVHVTIIKRDVIHSNLHLKVNCIVIVLH